MSRAERRMSRAVSVAQDQSLDEYERLVRYVSVYREPGMADMENEEGEMKRVWYAPWRRQFVPTSEAAEAKQMFPDEWLLTDIKQGLSEAEVNNRRRRSGWNELISQKENPIAKFMSYFQGPILYGKSNRSSIFKLIQTSG
jgi:H+-transporting ATPase